jgi:arginyl-tRNA synthetase
MLPYRVIEQRLQAAVLAVLPDADTGSVLVRPCPDPKFGDYQSNALMSLAKARKINPRQLAAQVLEKLHVADVCEEVEIAGAGFLNFRLKPEAMQGALAEAARGEHLFFEPAAHPRTVVVDFSSPNVAKPMHVGHIRSTILGDSLARTLRLLGHRVITDNHIGDWGTQFGMLLAGWKRQKAATGKEPATVDELVEIYREIQGAIKMETWTAAENRFPGQLEELRKKDVPEDKLVEALFKSLGPNKPLDLSPTEVESRKELVELQAGDAENLAIWKKMGQMSRAQFDETYARLGVKFDQTLGESFYNARLPALVGELKTKGIARESDGAMAVFFDEVSQLKNTPALIQKRDGAFNYTTTDLATIAYRLETWHPDELIYVTDGRQQLHFQQFFTIFRRWQAEAKVKLAHVWFGSILGEDGTPFKTRSGETVKLTDLLDEAEERAFKVVSEKSPELPESQRREISRVVGIGAVKYADLLSNRQSDYMFSWNKMLALSGNTAPYLQYAYARIRSIFRRGGIESAGETPPGKVALIEPQEIALARQLLNFGFALEAAAEQYRPNFLSDYLFELAGYFTAFYENCPVLKAEPAQRASRLVLCDLTARVLRQGLEVLGIETLEQM